MSYLTTLNRDAKCRLLYLQNFEILYKDRQKLTNEVMSLADRIITEYSVIKRHIKSNDEIRREVARRILELVEEDLE